MPTTFAEMQATLNQTRFQKAILAHLVEHLDAEFVPVLDQQPKKALLTNEKVLVPQDAFENVITNLTTWLKMCEEQEKALLASAITVVPPAPPAEQPVTPPSEAQS